MAEPTIPVRETNRLAGALSCPSCDGNCVAVDAAPPARLWWRSRALWLTAASGLAWLFGFTTTLLNGPAAVANGSFLTGTAFAAATLYRQTWNSLRRFSFDMNVLMTLAAAGALFLGELSEGAMVVFLFAVAGQLETYSLARAQRAIESLMTLAPDRAAVLDDFGEQNMAPERVRVGAMIVVRPGERLPLDGVIRSGRSRVNQAPITGEAMPVEKGVGDEVLAGTINGEGTLHIETTRLASQSTLARIIDLVRDAQAAKAPSQRLVDRFAKVYTPLVIGVAVLLTAVPVFAFGQPFATWFYRSLVVLLVGCPCALVIATPVTVVAALARAARSGVLVKGGAALEQAAHIRAVALDKTGTVTRGMPKVVDVVALDGVRPQRLVQVAAAVEKYAGHVLAAAILEHAEAAQIAVPVATEVHALPGLGAAGQVEGQQVFVGSHRLFHERALCTDALHSLAVDLEKSARSLVFVGVRGDAQGVIVLDDPLREDARCGLEALREVGVERLSLLTGDNEATAKIVGRHLPLDDVQAELLPAQKVEAIRAMRRSHHGVAMVGDGINDAPALAAADLGIAMGQGADQALETADVALLSGELGKVAWLFRLAKRSVRRIGVNVALAVGLKLGVLLLALVGYGTLWMAVFADTGASLIVIANGLRLLNEKN